MLSHVANIFTFIYHVLQSNTEYRFGINHQYYVKINVDLL